MDSRYRRTLLILAALTSVVVVSCARQDKPVLEEHFQSPDQTWGEQSGDAFSRGYANDGYFFQISRPNWFTWTASAKEFRDTRVVIGARLISGSEDNHHGVICRMDGAGAFYYLAISSDGYYGIFRRVNSGSLEAINESGGMVHSPAIRTGNTANILEAICEGDRLSLSANGELLETVIDGTLRKGRIGFGAGNGAVDNVRVGFDDLAIYAR